MLWANRDEFRARPAAPLGRWSDDPELVGGRDLQEGGAWMLLSTKRRLAAVTNVRRAPLARGARSRGHLVRAFVDASASAPEWLAARDDEAGDYAPFNLLVWDGGQLMLGSRLDGFAVQSLEPGVYGISNGPALAPWAKSAKLVRALRHWLVQTPEATALPDLEAAWTALFDPALLADEDLPDTGIGLERERWLSASFVDGETYGTRASTVVLAGAQGWHMLERRFHAGRQLTGATHLQGDWR